MGRRGNRSRGRRGYYARRINVREPKQRFLIVCEGEQTEPNYFRAFRVPGKVEVTVLGEGRDPLALVETAEDKRDEDEYDQVWCVFDRDDVPRERFNRALERARRTGVRVAYSNQAFELWYVLHFEFANSVLTRQRYCEKLGRLLETPYIKNTSTLYERLRARQPEALRNAERLLAQYEPSNPAEDDPSTTVHLLVQQLNRFL